ncbi:MAG: hypothetical protein K8F28_01960 [Ignavibacteriaceae bacterium]|nr:hypothetical protein [Ignavibacteriaceae bacterium]
MALFSSGKKIVELNEEILSLQTEASKLKQLNEKLSLENKELRTENNSLVIEAETLRAQINNFMEKYTDVEELEKKAGTLRQEIDELTAAALNLPAESYENVPEQIKKEIEVLEDYKASLAKEIVEKENELENLKMQISSFKDISIESESIPVDNLQKLTAQQDTLQEIIVELTNQKNNLEAEIAQLKAEKDSLTVFPHFDPDNPFGPLTEKKDTTQAPVSSTETEPETSETVLPTPDESRELIVALTTKVEELQAENLKLNDEVDALIQELEVAKNSLSDLQSRQQVQEHRDEDTPNDETATVDESSPENTESDAVAADESSPEHSPENTESDAVAVDESSTEQTPEANENNNITSEYGIETKSVTTDETAPESETIYAERQKALNEFLEQRESLSKEVNELKRQSEELTLLIEQKRAEFEGNSGEVTRLDDKKNQVYLNIQQLEEKRAILIKEIASLEDSRTALAESVNDLNGKISALETTSSIFEEKQRKTEDLLSQALKNFNSEFNSLKEQQNKIRTDIIENERNRSEKEAEIEKLDLRLNELQLEVKIAEKDFENIRRQIASFKEEKEALSRNLFDLKDTEKRLNLLINDLRKNREGLKDENELLERKLTSMLNSFTQKHSEREKRKDELEKTLKNKQDELAQINQNIDKLTLSLENLKKEISSLELQKVELLGSVEKIKKSKKKPDEN